MRSALLSILVLTACQAQSRRLLLVDLALSDPRSLSSPAASRSRTVPFARTACRLTRGLGGDPSFAAGAGAERPPLRGSPVTTLVLRLPSNGRSLSTQRTRRPITSTAASCGGSVGTPPAPPRFVARSPLSPSGPLRSRRLGIGRSWTATSRKRVACLTALTLNPALPLALSRRALLRTHVGDFAGALADYETAWSLTQDPAFRSAIETTQALMDVAAGDTAAARVRLERIRRDMPAEVLGQVSILTALHRGDEAVDLLEPLEELGLELWNRLREPQFDELRAHPRFQQVMDRVRPRESRPGAPK